MPCAIVGIGAKQFRVRLDHEPRVDRDFLLELVLRPPGIAEKDAEFFIMAGGQVQFAFRSLHGLKFAGLGGRIPLEGGDDDLVAMDRSTFVDRHVGDLVQGVADVQVGGVLAERPVENEAKCALIRAVVGKVKDGPPKIWVGHHGVGNEQ